MLSDTQSKIAMVVVALVVIGLAYFLWKRTAAPAPTIPPGQSLQNPFGTDMGPGRPRTGPPGMGRR